MPAIIYQVMVPLWSRTWRFNNVYAYTTLDLLFAIMWFAASVAVAVWNARGIAKGKTNSTSAGSTSDGTCASFGYGSESKCTVSKATVGFGIIVFLTFGLTSYLSIRSMVEYRRTGVVPIASKNDQSHGQADTLGGDDPNQNVWSANTDELNASNDRLQEEPSMQGDREGLLPQNTIAEMSQPVDRMAHPGRRLSYEVQTPGDAAPPYDDAFAPSALSPTGLATSPNGMVQFPQANYNALR